MRDTIEPDAGAFGSLAAKAQAALAADVHVGVQGIVSCFETKPQIDRVAFGELLKENRQMVGGGDHHGAVERVGFRGGAATRLPTPGRFTASAFRSVDFA